MTEEDFLALKAKSDEVEDKYNKNTEKKFIIIYTDFLDQYPYTTTKLERLYDPEDLGFTDRFFGGNIHKVGKIKGKPFMILASQDNKTMGLYIPNDKMKDCTVALLKDLCDRANIEYEKNDNKESIIGKLTNNT